VTLTDTADTVSRRRMLTAAKSWINQSPLPQHCIGAADWLSAGGENPLLRHHPVTVAREMLLAVIDRVLSEVGEDDDASDDVQKVRSNFDRVGNYIAALKLLAV